MPGLDLCRHVEARGAQDLRRCLGGRGRRRRVSVPGRGGEALGDARAHEIVIGRVELDGVAAEPLSVERLELRRVRVGLPSQFEHGGRAEAAAKGGQRRVGAAVMRNRVLQRLVAAKEVNVLVRRRLVRKVGGDPDHGKPSLSMHPPHPQNVARPAKCGNAPPAALPGPTTPPIDATLMDIATPTPGRPNRAARLRLAHKRLHYIHDRVPAIACLRSTRAGKGGNADATVDGPSSGKRDS